MATTFEKARRAPTVFSSLTGKAREGILEIVPETFDDENGMLILYEKLTTFFKVDNNLAALVANESFEKYIRKIASTN